MGSDVANTVKEAVTGQLDVSATALADGLAANPLAWFCVILLFLLISSATFLVKALMASYEARISLMEKMYDLLLTTHSGTVTLGLKYTEGLDVLDKALDRFTIERTQ